MNTNGEQGAKGTATTSINGRMFLPPVDLKVQALEILALGYSDFRAQREMGQLRGTISRWRDEDPAFATAYTKAKAEAPFHIWDSLLDAALSGNNRAAVDWLKGHGHIKPEAVNIQHSGSIEVHQMPDSELEAIVARGSGVGISTN